MFRRFNKKGTIAVLSIVATLALAAGAYAYFTSTGSGTGNVSVGSSTPFTVTPSAATGGPLLPGSGTMTVPYTVTNPSSGNQNLSSVTAALASNGSGDITHSGVAVTGCKASWFTVTANAPTAPTALPDDLAGGATATGGTVTVTMQDSGTNQNACESATPDVVISAS